MVWTSEALQSHQAVSDQEKKTSCERHLTAQNQSFLIAKGVNRYILSANVDEMR